MKLSSKAKIFIIFNYIIWKDTVVSLCFPGSSFCIRSNTPFAFDRIVVMFELSSFSASSFWEPSISSESDAFKSRTSWYDMTSFSGWIIAVDEIWAAHLERSQSALPQKWQTTFACMVVLQVSYFSDILVGLHLN